MKPKKLSSLFSNGSEYGAFMEHNCYQCKKYVSYDEATDHNPVCPIEDAILLAASDVGEETFPWDSLKENDSMSRYDCLDKEK